MADPFEGKLDGKGSGINQIRIRLDADAGDVIVGGDGRGGDVILRDDANAIKIRLNAGGTEAASQFTPPVEAMTEGILLSGDTGTISLIRPGVGGGTPVAGIKLEATGDMSVGDKETSDYVLLKSNDGKLRINLDAGGGNIWLGGQNADGDLLLFPKAAIDINDTSQATVWLNGQRGNIRLRQDKALTGKGKLLVEIAADEAPDNPSKATVYLEGASATLRMRDAEGNEHTLLNGANGNLWLGGKKADGDVVLFKEGAKDNRNTDEAAIWLDAGGRTIRLRSETDEGKMKDRITLDAKRAKIVLGGHDEDGDVLVYASGKGSKALDDPNQAAIWIRGKTGDILLANSDCAEDFDVSGSEEVEPGTVMVLDREGKLVESTAAYDKKVAGVISGAGEHRPGIVLGRTSAQNRRLPVALLGKAYCKVDARDAPIEVGDLLTTSTTQGHAMKASDPLRALGAVIGKALRPLGEGTGLIPVLIALQ
jgi:hypothetical protein